MFGENQGDTGARSIPTDVLRFSEQFMTFNQLSGEVRTYHGSLRSQNGMGRGGAAVCDKFCGSIDKNRSEITPASAGLTSSS